MCTLTPRHSSIAKISLGLLLMLGVIGGVLCMLRLIKEGDRVSLEYYLEHHFIGRYLDSLEWLMFILPILGLIGGILAVVSGIFYSFRILGLTTGFINLVNVFVLVGNSISLGLAINSMLNDKQSMTDIVVKVFAMIIIFLVLSIALVAVSMAISVYSFMTVKKVA